MDYGACSSMPERDGKDQGEDSPKQAGSCWFARHTVVKSQVARTCILQGDVVLSFSGVTFGLFYFVFVFLLLLKPRPFVQSFFVLRYACDPTATRSYITTVCVLSRFCFFLFLFLWRYRFFRVCFHRVTRFLFVWRVRRTFSPLRMVLLYLVTTGWIFDISSCESSIKSKSTRSSSHPTDSPRKTYYLPPLPPSYPNNKRPILSPVAESTQRVHLSRPLQNACP